MLILDPDYPEGLGFIARAIYDGLTQDLGQSHADAQKAAMILAESIRTRVGGSAFYLPRGTRWDAELRRRAVLADLEKQPGCYNEVASRHRLTVTRVRQIEAQSLDSGRRDPPGQRQFEPQP